MRVGRRSSIAPPSSVIRSKHVTSCETIKMHISEPTSPELPADVERHLLRKHRRYADLDAEHDAYISLRKKYSTVWTGALKNRTKLRRITLQRSRRPHIDLDEVNPHGSYPTPLDELLRMEQMTEVRRAIDRLPPAMRDAITKHWLQGLPVAEIATLSACPDGTVRSRLRLGLERLSQNPRLHQIDG